MAYSRRASAAGQSGQPGRLVRQDARMNVSPPPGYYPDPAAPGYLMYWDGAAWAPASRRPADAGVGAGAGVSGSQPAPAQPARPVSPPGVPAGVNPPAAPAVSAASAAAPPIPPPAAPADPLPPRVSAVFPHAGEIPVRSDIASPDRLSPIDDAPSLVESASTPFAPAPFEPSRSTPLPWEADPTAWAALPDLAASGARLAARTVDLIIVLVLAAVPSLPVLLAIMARITDQIRAAQAGSTTTTVYLVNGQTLGLWALCLAIILAISGGYEVWQLARWGQTVGKRLVNVRVADRDGVRDPSLGQALGRWLGYYVLLCVPVLGLLDAAWLLWDQSTRQCLHDKLAGTVVVREPT